MKFFNKLWTLALLLSLGIGWQINAQNVTYGFTQNPGDPVEITAVAYPDFTSGDVTLVTSVFTFLLPAGTTTAPSIPVAPASGSFTNITGNWTAQLITPAVYAAATGQPEADLQGYDVYQVVLQNSPEIMVTSGTPIQLFRLRLTNDCIGGNVEVLTNDGAIQQAILTNLSANFNNQMSMSVDNAPTTDTYNSNDPSTFSYECPLDDTPTATDDMAMTAEDMAILVDVLANDDFGNNGPSTGAITIVGVPVNGTAMVNDNGTPNDPTDDTFTFTPDANFNGIGSFVYQICDTDGDCDMATATITVNAANDAPDAMDDMATTDEDMAVDIDVLNNDVDADNDPLTITMVSTPANGTAVINDNGTPADPTDDYVVYTPNANFNGADSFTYTISDGNGGMDMATVNIMVNAVNDVPDAMDDMATTDEDMAVNIDVLDNDVDADNDPLTITMVSTPANGTAVINNNGTPGDPTDDYVVYTPNANFNGTDSFTYTISDGNGGTDMATVNVTINPVDDAADAMDDIAMVDEDMMVNIPVLNNDDVPDGVASIMVQTPPTNGTAMVDDNGTPADPSDDIIIYTPNPDFNGMDSFTYQVCDTDGDCDQATVTVTVNPVDDAADAVDDTPMTDEDTPVNVPVLNNDDVPDGVASIMVQTPPTNGTAMVDDNGTPADPSDDTIIYTPNPDFNGMDSFTYQVCDTDGDCDQATVNVTVNPVDDAADAVDDAAMTNENTATNVTVLNNDDVPDGIASTMVQTMPMNGTAVVNNNGTPGNPSDDYIIYTPNTNFTGMDSFTYQVCDTDGDCDQATVMVTVGAVYVRLLAKMQLQGALLDSPDTLMRDDLRQDGVIPSTEPYTALAGFTHVGGGGGEMVTNMAVFGDFGANSIVDWVFVELRSSANPATVLATRSALLQRDGDVVDVDGVSSLLFSQSVAGSYYVAVRHRNHLGTMTASAIALSASGTTVDFTDTNLDLYNTSAAFNGREQVTINDKYALWAGNSNVNQSVVYAGESNDKDPIFNEVDQAAGNVLKIQTYIYSGYRLGDIKLDSATVFAGQNNDVDPIFNNVDGHPANTLKLQTFVIPEQLAH